MKTKKHSLNLEGKILNSKLVIGLTLVAGLVVSSCSTSGFLKRKYTNGMYLENIAKKKSAERDFVKDRQAEKKYITSEKFIDTEQSNTDNYSYPSIKEKNKYSDKVLVSENTEKHKLSSYSNVNSSPKKSYVSSNHKKHTSVIISKNEYEKQFNFIPYTNHNLINKVTKYTHSSDDDKIIQVILALFPVLCLIAIYLHDGNKITNNFWIDLILHLTFLGEIIFALLVVLDVINLA